jgi:parallel beta-helix repeat protein
MRFVRGVVVLALLCGSVVLAHGADAASLCGSTLTANKKLHHNVHCSGTGITIGADSIVLNLNGFTLSGTRAVGSVGVSASNHTGLTIKNGTVSHFENGIVLDNVSTGTVSRIHANRNGQNGIVIRAGSTNITVNQSSAAHNITDGFDIEDSPSNTIKNSTASRNTQDGFDVSFSGSTGNALTGNHASHNTQYGFFVELSPTSTTLDSDVATKNVSDGINIYSTDVSNQVANSTANFNQNDGIRASASGQDGGGNHAHGNQGSEECLNVSC